MVWIHIFWELKGNLLVYRLIRNEALLMLFNSKQLSHEIKFTLLYSLSYKKKKDFLKALFVHTSLILGSDQNTSLRRAHHFSEADVLPKPMLATLIFKRKSSAPAPVLIPQGSSFTTSMQLHKDEDLEELAGDVSEEDNFETGELPQAYKKCFYLPKLGSEHLSLQLIPMGWDSRWTRISQSSAG